MLQAVRACGQRMVVWSVTRGLVDEHGKSVGAKTREVAEVLRVIERGKPDSVYVMLGFEEQLKDETVQRMLAVPAASSSRR